MNNILLVRKFKSFLNTLKAMRGWTLVKNIMFAGIGVLMLLLLYFGFHKVLKYLETVQLIGPILSWKLTSMVLLMMFAMVIVSSVIISMTTLYYSFDLKFLLSSPLKTRFVFMDKAMDTVIYSSWTLVLAIFPYVIALGKIKSLDLGFYCSYLLLMIPFVMLAGAFGIFFSMIIMYVFPSSKTRDITWVLGSLSVAIVYVVFRFAEPERLLRPDSLAVIAEYIKFIQAPTAPYFPSWWVTKAMMGYSTGNMTVFLKFTALLFGSAFGLYALMYYISDYLYMRGFNGAQNSPRFHGKRELFIEQKLIKFFPSFKIPLTMYWKDRLMFLRDAKYWSQIILIAALVSVYLFSIKQLPLETPSVKSFVCFLNIAAAGFVTAAIGLRFTFPAISLEGNNFWIIKNSPISIASIMKEKLLISLPSAVIIGLILVGVSNYLLGADLFISSLTAFTIAVTACVVTVMGIGFGALFPDFRVENIHKLESSYGGFLYMACSMAYIGLIICTEAWPVQLHFRGEKLPMNWLMISTAVCSLGFIIITAVAVILPWKFGKKNLSNYE